MSASISDPFLLSSFALSSRPASSSSNVRREHVLVGHRHSSSTDKGDGLAAVAVQGDGVHVLDLSTLHPAISHTLGPSTTLSCPPVTRTTQSGGVQTCTTFAVIDSSPDISKEYRGRTVWMWEERLSGGVMSGDGQKNKKTAVMPQHITQLNVFDDRVLLIDPKGSLTIADMGLNIQSSPSSQVSAEEASLIKHFAFPRKSCPFVSSHTASGHRIIGVAFLQSGEKLSVSLTAADYEGAVHTLGECSIPVTASDVADISLSPEGYISVLTRSGSWYPFQIANTSSSLVLSSLSEPLYLTSFSFLSPSPSSSARPYKAEYALLALTSSHVLLAAISPVLGGQPEVVLLIWDLQYGVLLAETRCPVPSTLGRTKQRGVRMQLVSQSHGQALLVLSPIVDSTNASHVDGSNNPLRSSVLVVPYTVPAASTIAGALGRAAFGAKWLKPPGKNAKQAYGSSVDPVQAKLLGVMRGAMEKKQPEVAEKAFEDWLADEETKTQDRSLIDVNVHPDPANRAERKSRLEYVFVKQVLDIVLSALAVSGSSSTISNVPYAPKVVRHLLEQGAVSDGMVEGGLIPAFMSQQDWQSAVLAVRTVTDLPESDVIHLLSKVVSHHRQTSSDENTMQVDSSSAVPSLPSFLILCATYSMSPTALKFALHQHLSDAEDILCVLGVLDGWVERWCQEEVRLLPDRVKKDAHGIPVPLFVEHKKEDMPPLDKVVAFIQAVLDASFLTVLAHPPAHRVIKTLLARLQPELAFVSDLQSLSGPLQPFAAAHARAVHEGAHGAAKADNRVDWRRRKKMAHEQAELSLGLYQVEELVI